MDNTNKPNLNSMTTKEVYEYIVTLYKARFPDLEREPDFEDIYSSLDWAYEESNEVGEGSQGGEGEGEYYVRVYKIGERFFQIEGHYQSYNGVDYAEGSFKEVFPVKVLVTKYLESKE